MTQFPIGSRDACLFYDPANPTAFFDDLKNYRPTRDAAVGAVKYEQIKIVEAFRILYDLGEHIKDPAFVDAAALQKKALGRCSTAPEYVVLRLSIDYEGQWRGLEGDEHKRVRANTMKEVAVHAAALRYLLASKRSPDEAAGLIGKPGEGIRAWADRGRQGIGGGPKLLARGTWPVTGARLTIGLVAYDGAGPDATIVQVMRLARKSDVSFANTHAKRVLKEARAAERAEKQVETDKATTISTGGDRRAPAKKAVSKASGDGEMRTGRKKVKAKVAPGIADCVLFRSAGDLKPRRSVRMRYGRE